MAPADTVIKPTCCTVATEEAATFVPIAVSSVATSAAVETVDSGYRGGSDCRTVN